MKEYLDQKASVDQRVNDLLSRMTLEEKVKQVAMCEAGRLIENGKFSPELAKEVLGKTLVGTITTPNLSPEHIITFVNDLQAYCQDASDLGIPVMMVGECIHGLMVEGATIFPHAIAMASSFNEGLMEETARIIAKESSLIGVRQGLAPVLDLAREPRWGRVEETYGEDPYLCERFGLAYIRGLQGAYTDGLLGQGKIAATLKHFAAHGSPEGGINLGPVPVGERQLRELYLPPFEKAIQEGGALSVMNAYSEVDGIPCAASTYLLTDILRHQWGFEGYVIADFESISMLKTFQKTAATYKEAGRQAFQAGLDLEAPSSLCYGQNLVDLVNEGVISMNQIDASVSRVLRVKFMTGLFDQRQSLPTEIRDHYNSDSHQALARQAAEESIILLKNKGRILPLSQSIEKIAVIGPNADQAQMGDYSIDKAGVVTPLEALRQVFGDDRVAYSEGCKLFDMSMASIAEAADLAKQAQVAIVCVGGRSMIGCGVGWESPSEFAGYAFKEKYASCGEGFDRSDLNLPGRQQELVEAVVATGTPTIVVLINGRPYSTPWIRDHVDGLIEMWYAGEEGGHALAGIIAGSVNPSGKLPISIPKDVGQLPIYYNHKPSARGFYGNPGSPTSPGRDYVFMDTNPLYPFGYGLSYTEFSYEGLSVDQVISLPKDVSKLRIEISVMVANIGQVTGKEAVLLYVNDLVSSVSTPVKSLRAFKKIELKPGACEKVCFQLGFDDLALYDRNMKKVVEPGDFQVSIGDVTRTFTLQ